MLFTTVPARELSGRQVGELYRFRWQIELAFKRLKQLLSLGHVMYKEPRAVRTWILAKLVVALLMEKVRMECSHASFRGWTG
jgi:IS4 transposase